MADCEERLGHLATALEHFRKARGELAPGDFRIPFAEGRIASLARRAPQLTVTVEPPLAGAQVLRDDIEMPEAALGSAAAVDPGAHTLVLHVPGREDARTAVTLREGEQRTLTLEPGRIRASSGQWSASDTRALGYVSGGIGIVGLGVGIATDIVAIGAANRYKAHCDSAGRCDAEGLDAASTGRTMAILSPAGFIAGAAGLGLGAYLLWTSPKSAQRAATLRPVVGPHGPGLGVSGTF